MAVCLSQTYTLTSPAHRGCPDCQQDWEKIQHITQDSDAKEVTLETGPVLSELPHRHRHELQFPLQLHIRITGGSLQIIGAWDPPQTHGISSEHGAWTCVLVKSSRWGGLETQPNPTKKVSQSQNSVLALEASTPLYSSLETSPQLVTGWAGGWPPPTAKHTAPISGPTETDRLNPSTSAVPPHCTQHSPPLQEDGKQFGEAV